LSYAPTKASKNELTVKIINFGAELETETNNIIEATKLQSENLEIQPQELVPMIFQDSAMS